ncbi:prolyl 3-hydroxylase OGFOD1-like [Penaeus monodon]|uniref:prolyl 3-hydroxylase OGFOD1-like n=1 Tax=Penaeus monodon TaxID=6687 RepID=UPI0018A6EE7C|nr:prolyl 3-hydroxylase OGFOD1-like [Penaeus monodon]
MKKVNEVQQETSGNAAGPDAQAVKKKKRRGKRKKKVVATVTNGAAQEQTKKKKRKKRGKKRARTNSAGESVDGMQSAGGQAGTDPQVNSPEAKGKKLKKSNDNDNTSGPLETVGKEKLKVNNQDMLVESKGKKKLKVNDEGVPVEGKGKKKAKKVNNEAMPVEAKGKKRELEEENDECELVDVKKTEKDKDGKTSVKKKKINADKEGKVDVPEASSETKEMENKNNEKVVFEKKLKKKKKMKKSKQNQVSTNSTAEDGAQDPRGTEEDEPPVNKAKDLTAEPESSEPQRPEGDVGTPTKKKKKKKKKPTSGAVSLSTAYSDLTNKNEIKKHWTEDGAPLKRDNGLEIIKTPFTCGYLPGFLENADILKSIEEELKDIPPLKKNNDLYKFTQTPDLKSSDKPHILRLRNFLYGNFRKWLTDVTGIPLNETVDMGSSTYEHTDVLLCHDDELEGRRIAYILYLVPAWEASDGGTLDLFDTDSTCGQVFFSHPFGCFWSHYAQLFFYVLYSYNSVISRKTFKHQTLLTLCAGSTRWMISVILILVVKVFIVAIIERQDGLVVTRDKTRLSINGWFHGPPIDRPPKYEEPPRPFLCPKHVEEDVLYSWINPAYLEESTQKTIRKKFGTDSEIELESFLTEEKYEALSRALKDQGLKWKRTGPANKNSYQVLTNKQPEVLKECLSVLQSEAMFLILSQLTGLSLHKLAPPDSEPDSDEEDEEKEPNPRLRVRVGHWSHGSYTLIRDSDAEEQESALDATLFVCVSDKWTEDLGGYNSYISKDEDAELLSVLPRSNCFALVYRDAETLKFTKHINAGVLDLEEEDRHYFDVNCKYYE